MPAAHPFNPIALLRLALGAAGADDLPNRRVCEQIFHHVWRGGASATDPERLTALQAQFEKLGQLRRDPQSPEVKDQLKRLTQEAIDAGVFGVPTFEVDGKLFWGLDALPMLRDYLQNDAWFQGSAWSSVSQIQVGIERKR
jgi:2-hydroxychromene-2-carboxylate isomerase